MAAVINIFGLIGEGDMFFGTEGVTAKYISEQLDLYKDEKEITVKISSYGGDVDAGETIYNLFKDSGKTINVEIVGQCYSIATVIAMAGTTIKTAKNSRWMIHQAWTYSQQGNADDFAAISESLRVRDAAIFEYYMARPEAKKNETKLKEYFTAEKELTAQEAVDLGLCDGLIDNIKDMAIPYPFKAVAYFSPNKNNIMSNVLEQKTFLDKIENMFKKFTAKNNVVNLKTATDKGDVYSEGALAVDALAFSDEAMTTSMPDGDYTAGTDTITISGGKVTAVATAQAKADPAIEAMKTEIETLKNQLAEKTTAFDTLKTESEKLNAEIKTELNELKGMAVNLNKDVPAKPEAPDTPFKKYWQNKLQKDKIFN